MKSSTTAALFALGLALIPGCASKPAYYRDPMAGVEPGSRLAVLPLVNMTKDVNAPDVVMNALVVEILATNRFSLVDPGVVDEVIQRERIRLTDRIPLQTLQAVGAALGVEYVIVGSVNEYQMVKDAQDVVPTVSMALRMVSCNTGAIAWAATHSLRGNDRESVFTLGRIGTLQELASVTAHEMVKTMTTKDGKTIPVSAETKTPSEEGTSP
ncbi:MAG TPA: GNA1162 family protein [Gemmatimonadaceae bacterium]